MNGRLPIWFLLVVTIAASLVVQLLAQTSEQSQEYYQGQQVGNVDLAGRPETEPLRPLVLQKANEPYSEAKVQQTVSALEKTGKFAKVDVQVIPETNGLRVLFVLQPADYLGVFQFPGAIGPFAYSQLLNVVNYPAEGPYEESLVAAAVPALQRFFAENGYFNTEVKSQTEFDEPHRLANVTFEIKLNKLAKWGNVTVAGVAPAEASKLERSLRSLGARLRAADVRPGKPFKAAHLRAASSLISRALTSENRLAGQVHWDEPVYHPETNRADVTFEVSIGPKVEVHTVGATISQRRLKKLVPIWQENSVDQDLVDEGQRNIASYFQEKGYFDVKAESQIERQAAEVIVSYQITLGDKHRLRNVRITGNHHFTEGRLMEEIRIKKSGWFSRGKFSQELLDQSIKNLETVYKNAGYADVQIRTDVVEQDSNVKLSFIVTEGVQTLVSSLHVEGNQTQSLKAIAPKGFQLHAGAPYSPLALEQDRNQVVANYLDLGYRIVSFRSTVARVAGNPHRVNVTYLINEGPQVHVGQVAYVGQQVAREQFVERNTTIRPEDDLSESKMLASESKLYNLGAFDWADVSPLEPVSDQTQDEVVVRVHEAQRNSLSWGFGFLVTSKTGGLSSGVLSLPGLPTIGLPSGFTAIQKTIISPIGSVEYSRDDLFGEGQTGSVSTSLSLLDQKGSMTYTIPDFFGEWTSSFTASIDRNELNPLFTARLELGSWQLEKILDAKRTQRLQLRYTFQQSLLSNLLVLNFVPPEDLSVRSSFPSISYIRDTRDNPLDAHKGVFQTLDFRVVPTALGSSDNYLRFFGQNATYWELKPWLVWANNFRFGAEKAFASSHVPFGDQFFSGGADSLRGFPLNSAGPQKIAVLCTTANNPSTCTANVTVPTGGRELFIFNSEARFPIPLTIGPIKGLGGVIFYDGGNVFAPLGFAGFSTNYSNTVGVGLRYQTPVGPIRLDVGRNLNPVPGLNPTQLFVTLGQSF